MTHACGLHSAAATALVVTRRDSAPTAELPTLQGKPSRLCLIYAQIGAGKPGSDMGAMSRE